MVYGKSYETRWYKCHLLIATEKLININTDRTNVTNKKKQKLLGIKLIDPYLSNVTLQVSVKKIVKSYMHQQE